MVMIIIVLLIWFVYPALTNPLAVTELWKKRAELAKDKAQLDAIIQKSAVMNSLEQKPQFQPDVFQ